jgi:dipeptidyl aminopeptidase/acylaminoacyl peptidase
MRRVACVLAALAVVAVPTAEALAAAHPFNVRDLVMFRRVSEPRPAPDGRQVAFVLRTTDLEANRGRTDILVARAASCTSRTRTTGC